jgi:hypothetical protein
MTPALFTAMTPHELTLAADAYRDREQRTDRRAAWLAAHLMNCWLTTPVTPKQLLGEPEPSQEDAVRQLLADHFGEAAPHPLTAGEQLNALLGDG